MKAQLTAKANIAKGYQERASRDGACGLNKKAAKAWLKAAELFEDVGMREQAEHAWRRCCEFAERRADDIAQLPDFDC